MRLKTAFLLLLSFSISFQLNAKELSGDKGGNFSALSTQNSTKTSEKSSSPDGYNGLHGYIGFGSGSAPADYNMGMGFYASVWSLVSKPLSGFQIGLPSSWIIPDNRDNNSTPLCPVGTYARDNWPERGPTWGSVFQTVEGGLGYWAGNRFRYGPPKFSMNGTSQCYDYQIASPGWGFFGNSSPLSDDKSGVAQLSNRLLIPPDGLTFAGEQNGAMFGYSWMALPFMEAKTGEMPTGENSWTCFINATNFKGPIAYYVAETWSRMAYLFDYSFAYGRGLDSKPGYMGGGAMEINTVPFFKATDTSGTVYTKIPQLQFPVDNQGQSYLVSDVTYYSRSALYNAVGNWRDGGQAVSGKFADSGKWNPALYTYNINYSQEGVTLSGINDIMSTEVYDTYTWGLKWSENPGYFPQYFKQAGNIRVPVSSNDVPTETGLHSRTFPEATTGRAYEASITGAWAQPGPASQEYYSHLADGTKVTYRWYRFVDQPTFQQYYWTNTEKEKLQSLVEKIHTYWGIEKEYMTPPSKGTLATLDSGLIVTPPSGYEVGYVPVVVKQEYAPNEDGYCESKSSNSSYMYIQELSVDDFSNTSGAGFYSDFTSKTISMTIGESHTVSISPGYSNTAYTVGIRAWIDLNNDKDFADAGELLFEGMDNAEVNKTITIPETTTVGTKRMRIAVKYNDYPEQCETINYGEVEDYTVNITQGSCSKPEVTVTETSSSSISLSWNTAGAESYTVYFQPENENWELSATGITGTHFVLTGLSADKTYNVAVLSVCSDGTNLYQIVTAKTDDSALSADDLPGKYVREPASNSWHTGNISQSGNTLKWTNEAGRSWTLIPDLENEQLLTTDDCPYPGQNFTLMVEHNSDGSINVTGFMFLNELYSRQAE